MVWKEGAPSTIPLCLMLITLLLICGCSGLQGEAVRETITASDAPSWLAIPVTDLQTGETFTLESLMASGKPVIIHTFTISCPPCGFQFKEVTALQRANPGTYAVIGLNIDTNEEDQIIRRYAERNGYQGHFVTAPAPFLSGLIRTFGIRVMQSTPQTILIHHDTIYYLGPGVFSSEGLARILGDLSS